MNIFYREINVYRKSLIIWCIGAIFLLVSSMGKYTAPSSSGQSMNEIIQSMPKSLQVLMGASALDLSTAIGYYGVIFFYLLLMATIHAALLGANILSKEERDKTAEFLYSKPVSRNKVILFKLFAAFVHVVVFNFVTFVSSYFIVNHYSKGEDVFQDITALMGSMLILQIMFMFLGSAVASLSKNPKRSGGVATGVLLFSYILSIAIDLNEKLEFLKYISPFKYFQTDQLINGEGFEAIYLILSALIITILCCVTFLFFRKRDLHI